MATEQPTDTDALMHRALATYLPQDEPPIGMRVDDIMRLGRRRYRTRRAIPIAAAAVTVLAISLPWTINSSAPAPERLPAGTTSVPQTAGESSVGMSATTSPPSASGTIAVPPTQSGGQPDRGGGTTSSPTSSISTGSPRPAPFRLPPGHSQEDAATRLTQHGVENRLPAGRVTSYFGSRSDLAPRSGRHVYGMHMLWQEGDRYGYLFLLHRTKGEQPATGFLLPAEPCAEPGDRLSTYRCTAYPAPAGDVATSFEVDTNGYRMRGVVWDKKDPAGGPDIRVTGVFYLPAPGALTTFPLMDDAPRLARIPLAHADIAQLIGMPK